MRTLLFTILTAITIAFALPAIAQDPGPGPDPHDDRERGSKEDRERFKERLRLMRMVALTEALELDEATAAKLFPYMREGDAAQGEVHDAIRQHRKALKQMAEDENFDDKAIDEHIAAIGKLEEKMAGLRAEQVAGLKRILTAEQRLKFLLTRAHLERELRQALREHRRGERRERREHMLDEGGGRRRGE